MGKFFIFYYGERDWVECLTYYRERDFIEKGFKIMKNDIQSLPLNTNKDSTTKGFIFVCFIGLIIRMRLLSMMRETKIIEDYTVESLLLELEKIRKIELQNGEVIVTELTRKQKGSRKQTHRHLWKFSFVNGIFNMISSCITWSRLSQRLNF
jgi:transposase